MNYIYLAGDWMGNSIDTKVSDERGVSVVAVFDLDVIVGAVIVLHRALHLAVDVGENQVDALT